MNNNPRYGDNHCTDSNTRMVSSTENNNDNRFMTDEQFNSSVPDTSTNADGIIVETVDAGEDDAAATEAMQAVTKERHQIHKENAAKLQSILENIKHSTKIILREMDTYLQETEEVEKTFIRCRANTQKECQRMELVEPEVIAATQRFMAQGSQFFGGMGGSKNIMNMTSLMGTGGEDSMRMSNYATGDAMNEEASMMETTADPRRAS